MAIEGIIINAKGAIILLNFYLDWFGPTVFFSFEFWIFMSMMIGDVDRGLLLVVIRGNFKKVYMRFFDVDL